MNYFPSRFDPVRHSEKYPYQNMKVSGNREKMCIAKENNFAQAGARFRSFDPARQERFINRIAGMLTAPRVTQVCCQLKLQLALHPVNLQPLLVANACLPWHRPFSLHMFLATNAGLVVLCVCRQCRPLVGCILMCELQVLVHMRRLPAAQTG